MNTIFLLCALLSLPCLFGTNSNQEILWAKEIKLSWDDFIGEIPSEDGAFQAVTYSTIEVKSISGESPPVYTVMAKFIRNKSWAYNNLDEELLQHEQLHFDMKELYARKIRKSLDSLKTEDITNKTVYLDKIKYWLKVGRQEGDKYDTQTFHGDYSKAQKDWNNKISSELEKLEDYYITFYISH